MWSIVNDILIAVLGGTSIIAIYEAIKYRKENKKLKSLEVKSSEEDVEAKSIQNEKDKIELGNLFIQSAKEMMDAMKVNAASIEELNTTMKDFTERIILTESMTNHIITYLDGPFTDYLKAHGINLTSSNRSSRTKSKEKATI